MTGPITPIDRSFRGIAARRSVIAVIASAALLVACSSSGDAAPEESFVSAPNDTAVDSVAKTEAPPVTDPAPVTDPTPVTEPTTSQTSEPASTTTAPPAAPPVTAAPAGSTCLIGDWTISSNTLAAYFDAVEANSGFESIDGSGVIRLTFTDTTYEWVNDYSLAMVINGVPYEGVQAGGFSGTYTESDGVLTGSIDDEFRVGTITRDGSPLTEDPGDLFVDINPARPMDMLSYSCDGPTILLAAGPRADALFRIALDPA